MKTSHLCAAALLSSLALAAPAHATTVNLDLGSVMGGSSGSNTTPLDTSLDYAAMGSLAANSEVTFTLASTGSTGGTLTSTGTLGTSPSMIMGSATSVGGAASGGTLPILASANLLSGSGKVTIENTGVTAENFAAYFLADLMSATSGFTVSYTVSAVPLPASAVLMMTGLVAMAGFGAWRRKQIQ